MKTRAAKNYLVWPCMSWYRYFVVAATSVAVLLSSGPRHFGMAWRSSGSSNAQLVENLQGNLFLFIIHMLSCSKQISYNICRNLLSMIDRGTIQSGTLLKMQEKRMTDMKKIDESAGWKMQDVSCDIIGQKCSLGGKGNKFED